MGSASYSFAEVLKSSRKNQVQFHRDIPHPRKAQNGSELFILVSSLSSYFAVVNVTETYYFNHQVATQNIHNENRVRRESWLICRSL